MGPGCGLAVSQLAVRALASGPVGMAMASTAGRSLVPEHARRARAQPLQRAIEHPAVPSSLLVSLRSPGCADGGALCMTCPQAGLQRPMVLRSCLVGRAEPMPSEQALMHGLE